MNINSFSYKKDTQHEKYFIKLIVCLSIFVKFNDMILNIIAFDYHTPVSK